MNHLNPWKLIGDVPEGTCPECAVKHDPTQPHNKQSLAYQYKFFDEHGRWPTWTDAMAHCSPAVQQVWKWQLQKHGVKFDETNNTQTNERQNEKTDGPQSERAK